MKLCKPDELGLCKWCGLEVKLYCQECEVAPDVEVKVSGLLPYIPVKLKKRPEFAALDRLTKAAIIVADILDSGERDPTWHESQELEEAAIAYGRSVRTITPAPRGNGDGR